MNDFPTTLPRRNAQRRVSLLNGLVITIILAAATLLAHGWSLDDGLFLDDHWHQRQLQHGGWAWSDLLDATTLDPDWFMETWWQQKPIRWQYARPACILLMKIVYVATGGSVVAQHGVSLLLHLINACLVYTLCLWLTHHRFWSLVGGLLFVVYSHSVFAVGWLAAQNTVLMTTLMLSAMMLYIRASGLRLYPRETMPGRNDSSRGETNTSVWHRRRACDITGETPVPQVVPQVEPQVVSHQAAGHVPALRTGLFACAIVLWGLAFLSRENAVMLPVVLVAFDLAYGSRQHAKARLRAYAVMAVLTIAFLIWRLFVFYHPLPDVYFRRPDGSGSYLLWCLAKLMHYLTSAVWLSPMTVGPTGRFNPFTEVPGDCGLMFAILAIMGIGYFLAARKAAGWWIWPLWLVLSFLPVVPILATPHSGYLAGVAFSIAMILGPGLRECFEIRDSSFEFRVSSWSRPVAIWFLIATSIYIPIYRTLWTGMQAAEQYAPAKITTGPAPVGVSDIFFINLPFVNIYSKLCLEEEWGSSMEPVRCHALTYAPNLLMMEDRCTVEQLDSHRFTVSIEGKPYFSGLLGRYLIDSVRTSGPFHPEDRISNDAFDVEVIEASQDGIHKLLFRFHEPLTCKRYRFYLTTRNCGAAQIHFRPTSPERLTYENQPTRLAGIRPLAQSTFSREDIESANRRLTAGDATAAQTLFAAMKTGGSEMRRRSWRAFRLVAAPVAEAMGSPVQTLIENNDPTAAELTEIEIWWIASVENDTLRALWLRRNEYDKIRQARYGVFAVRGVASKIIQTDLYLTGPPFPGPRW